MENLVTGIIAIILLGLVFGLSWGGCVGVIWLVTKCFGIVFSLRIATGIWIVLVALKMMFKKSEE